MKFCSWSVVSGHLGQLLKINKRYLFLTVPEAGKSEVRVPAWVRFWWRSFSWLKDNWPLVVSSHRGDREEERE